MRRIAGVLVLLTVVLVALLMWKLRAQEAALHGPAGGSGEIEGTQVRVSAKLPARITEVLVKEGAPVKAGDVLVRLDCTDPQQLLTEAESRLRSAEANVKAAEAQVAVANNQRQAHSKARAAAEQQAEALAAQRDLNKRQAERLDAVAGDVAFSSRDQVRASVLGLEHQVSAAEATSQASAEQAAAASNQARAASAQAEAAEMMVTVARMGVERAKVLVGECELKAPRDASVEDVLFEPGELVGPGVVVVKLLDLSEVTATFYLPNAELSAVKPGERATLVADAYPGETFTGTVKTVALEAEFTPRNIQTRTDRDRLVYPVEVAVVNAGQKLRAGMPVQVTLESK